MVLAYIGIAIGVLLVVILIVKLVKDSIPARWQDLTPAAKGAVSETNGTSCPKCAEELAVVWSLTFSP